MAARPLRTWLLITAVVLVVLQGLLVLAWWMLPRWMPEQVIAYAPWPEPALRAWRWTGEADKFINVQRAMEAHLLDWGPDIGPALRYEFENGDENRRLRVVSLASEVARADGIKADTMLPNELRQSFGEDGIARLREDLVQLVLAAMADGSSYLPSNASYVAMSLRDPRTVPPACDFLAKQKPPVFEDLEPVIRFLGSMRDPRAVPILIPLLPIRHRAHPTVEEALKACLNESSVDHVIAATHHGHEVIRTWAMKHFQRYKTSAVLGDRVLALIADHERQVAISALVAALEHLPERAGPALLEAAAASKDEEVQLFATMGLRDLAYTPARPFLRQQAQTRRDGIGRYATMALGRMQDPQDAALLLSLLDEPDMVEAAMHALAEMPLNDEQRARVESAKAAQQGALQ